MHYFNKCLCKHSYPAWGVSLVHEPGCPVERIRLQVGALRLPMLLARRTAAAAETVHDWGGVGL